MQLIEDVYEFNQKIVKPEKVYSLNEERLKWFKGVVNEELNELEDAQNKNDRVGMLDALIDVTYFILGRVYELNYTPEQFFKAFEVVHNCNMRKKKGNKGRGSDTDAIKESTWIGPEEQIAKILELDYAQK